jgi:hypothetical protein
MKEIICVDSFWGGKSSSQAARGEEKSEGVGQKARARSGGKEKLENFWKKSAIRGQDTRIKKPPAVCLT